jgi:hypothetical protein
VSSGGSVTPRPAGPRGGSGVEQWPSLRLRSCYGLMGLTAGKSEHPCNRQGRLENWVGPDARVARVRSQAKAANATAG